MESFNLIICREAGFSAALNPIYVSVGNYEFKMMMGDARVITLPSCTQDVNFKFCSAFGPDTKKSISIDPMGRKEVKLVVSLKMKIKNTVLWWRQFNHEVVEIETRVELIGQNNCQSQNKFDATNSNINGSGVKYCPNCGKQASVSDKFCTSCGWQIYKLIIGLESNKNALSSITGTYLM